MLLPASIETTRPSIVFLVDRSGSMTGPPIQNVRTALSLFMHSLPADCDFDIIGFGFGFAPLFGELRPYSDVTLQATESYIRDLNADMGGTEILNPLRDILDRIKPNYLFLLTDGAVSNTAEVLDFVSHSKTTITTIGIGNAASVDLVRGIADRTGGLHEFVDAPSRISDVVIRSLSDTLRMALKNVSIVSTCGESYERVPGSLPRSRLQTFTFYSPVELQHCEMTLSGIRDGHTRFEQRFDLSDAHVLYSKILHSAFVVDAAEQDRLNASATMEFAKRFNLMTRYTGLLLYDNSTQHEHVDDTTVDIPILRSWPEDDGHSLCAHQSVRDPDIQFMDFGNSHDESGDLDDTIDLMDIAPDAPAPEGGGGENQVYVDDSAVKKEGGAVDQGVPPSGESAAIEIAALQSAAGAWTDLAEISRRLQRGNLEGKWSEQAMATALAVAHLTKTGDLRFSEIIQKGIGWLKGELGPNEANAIISWANSIVA
jgi:hypothetical protein